MEVVGAVLVIVAVVVILMANHWAKNYNWMRTNRRDDDE
jgi:hypothetical protein